MRQFIKRALRKINNRTPEQARGLLIAAADEIDRLETVIDSLTAGVLVCGVDHSLIMANRAAKRYLPISSDEQPPVWERVRDDKAAAFLQEVLESGDKVSDREFYVENLGQQRLLSVDVLPLARDGRVSGSLILVEDITEKRRREAQMRRMESLASLTTLAAGVAHEIKNPLGSLSIHVQLIQKAIAREQLPETFSGAVSKRLGIINEEIDRLNHIVVDFLFAVRPMDMEPREGDLNAFLKDLIGFVSFELEENNITCEADLQENLPLVNFDERYMKQAMLNLVKNAIAAMSGAAMGGVLSIKTRECDGDALITIADTGEGISAEVLPKIFEPYFTTKSTGSGLGLTLVYKIIHEHKGEIAAESTAGEGARFIITLPAAKKDLRSLPSPSKPSPAE